jgi:hypothetical protein
MSSSERPIFVIGAPRSGTTMLRYMLCAHPRIYIPPESNFIPRFLPYPPEKHLSFTTAVDLIDQTLNYKVFFRDWPDEPLDPQDFVNSLTKLTTFTLLTSLYRRYAGFHQAQRWGDKSPIYTTYVSKIGKLFPSAQFVHIIRDGRDVALSMMKAYQGVRFFYMDLCYAASSWQRRVQKARTEGAKLGKDRYIELHYEELTANPEKTLVKLCRFLEEPFVPEMAAPHQVAVKQYHSTGVHASTRKPLNTNSVGRWRKKMSQSDQRLFQALCDDLLQDLGYETLEVNKLSFHELVRLTSLRMKYSAVETGRRTLQAAGIVHPAAFFSTLTKGLRRKF